MTESREDTVSPLMFGLMNINLPPESDSSGKGSGGGKGYYSRTGRDFGSVGMLDPLDWELHLQTVAQQKKNQEEEAVRLTKRLIEHHKAKAAIQMTIGRYDKARALYTKVLERDHQDLEALLLRAECHYELKMYAEAIQDTRDTLSLDNHIAKAYGIQADSQYQLAEFEQALISYHRAKRLRPGVREYQHGINRAENVINAAIGENSGTQLELVGDLSYFDQFAEKNKENPAYIRATRRVARQSHSASTTKSSARRRDTRQARTVKQLLEELYGDYSYLEGLIRDEDKILHGLGRKDQAGSTSAKQRKISDRPGGNKKRREHTAGYVRDTVAEEITYLQRRAEFYRHLKCPHPAQQPQNETESETGRLSTASSVDSVTSAEELLELIEEIEADQSQGRHTQSLRKCQKALDFVQGQAYSELSTRDEFEAMLHSLLGNVHFEQENYITALENYEEDLSIARSRKGLEEAEARAMDNIGRTHAKMGQYSKAVEIFEQKLKLAKTSLELTWLHHELGRCRLELKDTAGALHHSEKALAEALEAQDKAWQLNSLVLKAQALEEMKSYSDALDVFRTALEVAKEDRDVQAQTAIYNAIDHVEEKQSKQQLQELNVKGDDETDDTEQYKNIKEDIEKANNEQEERDQNEAKKIRDIIKESNEEDNDDHRADQNQNQAKEMRDLIKQSNAEDNADHKEEAEGESTEQRENDQNEADATKAKEKNEQSKEHSEKEQQDMRSEILKSNADSEKKEAENIHKKAKASNKKAVGKGGHDSKVNKKSSGKSKPPVKAGKSAATKGTMKGVKKPAAKRSTKDKTGQNGGGKEDNVEEVGVVKEVDESKRIEEGQEGVDKDKAMDADGDEMDAAEMRDRILQSNQEESDKQEEGSGGTNEAQKNDFYD